MDAQEVIEISKGIIKLAILNISLELLYELQ